MRDLADDLALTQRAADAADAISMRFARDPRLHVDWKSDGSPVTAGDVAVERAIRELLGRERPDDGVVGEELGADTSSGIRWVIDPIDGTRSYLRGDIHWCTMIALMDGDTVLVGLVSAPILRRRWWAIRGGGAWCTVDDESPTRCASAATADLAAASLEYSKLSFREGDCLDPGLAALLRTARDVEGGNGYLSHMMVAQGCLDVALDNNDLIALWDVAAISLIVTEAGGAFGHLDGHRGPRGGGAVSATAALYDRVLLTLQGGRADPSLAG